MGGGSAGGSETVFFFFDMRAKNVTAGGRQNKNLIERNRHRCRLRNVVCARKACVQARKPLGPRERETSINGQQPLFGDGATIPGAEGRRSGKGRTGTKLSSRDHETPFFSSRNTPLPSGCFTEVGGERIIQRYFPERRKVLQSGGQAGEGEDEWDISFKTM